MTVTTATTYPTCSAWVLAKIRTSIVLRRAPLLARGLLLAAAADADRGLHDDNGYNGTLLGQLAVDVASTPLRVMDTAETLAGWGFLEKLRYDEDGPVVIRLPESFLQGMSDEPARPASDLLVRPQADPGCPGCVAFGDGCGTHGFRRI